MAYPETALSSFDTKIVPLMMVVLSIDSEETTFLLYVDELYVRIYFSTSSSVSVAYLDKKRVKRNELRKMPRSLRYLNINTSTKYINSFQELPLKLPTNLAILFPPRVRDQQVQQF